MNIGIDEYREELFEKMYYFELDRKDKAYSKLAFPATVVFIFGSVLFFYVKETKLSIPADFDLAWLFFLVSFAVISLGIVIAVVALAVVVYHLAGFILVRTPHEIEDEYEEFVDILDKVEIEGSEDITANDLLRAYMIKQFKEVATLNYKSNEGVFDALGWSNGGLIISLFGFLMSVVPFAIIYLNDKG